MTMLSIIIPSHNDVYLHRTIDSLLANADGDIEIIPVLDGYTPKVPIKEDHRIRIQKHGVNRGMREAINTGVAAARGQYLMRVDEHCMFGPGFDRIILDSIQDNWIVDFNRYFLDPVKWEVIPGKGPITYEKLLIVTKPGGRRKFSAVEWKSRARERTDISIDEKMAFQGSVWVMPKSWWQKVIVRLQTEGYGSLYQDTTEMLFKTWREGGKLMVNKKTWYAHKDRTFNRTHNYPGELSDSSFRYALDTWENDYKEVAKKWGIM